MNKRYAIGIDIGGTNTAFGIIDKDGDILSRGSIKTTGYADINQYISTLYEEIKTSVEIVGGFDMIQGIGIGVPCGNFYAGTIEHAANLPWKGVVEFTRLIEEKFGLKATLTNDANAAAIGEMRYGNAKEMKNFIMITLGTGVGSGIVIDGKVVYGHDGFAGELGHICIDRQNGRLCGCGRKGCLEAYTSATGVAITAREMLENTTQDSLLRHFPTDEITSKDVYDMAMQGDKVAKEVFEYTGKLLGEAFSDFVAFSTPEAFVLFGGLTKAGDELLVPIKEHMEANMLKMWKGKVKIVLSGLNENDAAILGASALAWS